MRLRNRQVKAEFWTDPDLLQLPRDMRVFYQGLWHCAEDSGCLEDSPFALKLLIFPSPVDSDITVELIGTWIEKFIDMKKLKRYEVRGKSYIFLTNFHKHQTLRNPGASEVPLAPWVRWEQSQDADGKKLPGKYVVLNLDETNSDSLEDDTNLDNDRIPFTSTRAEYYRRWLQNKLSNRELGYMVSNKMIEEIKRLEGELSSLRRDDCAKELNEIDTILRKHRIPTYDRAASINKALSRGYPEEWDNIRFWLEKSVSAIDDLKRKSGGEHDD